MKNFINNHVLNSLLFLCTILTQADAQSSISAQIRPRAEMRDGVGRLAPKDTASAGFVSQRTRLIFNSKLDKVAFGVAIQDVRVWGQDASTINNADGSKLQVHEAWAEVNLLDSNGLSIKMGRQELLYDDSRLLGNLDWLQQGRRHDAAVLKLNKKGWIVDFGIAFNQNTDAFGKIGTYYTAGNTPPYLANSKAVLTTIPADFVPTAGLGGAPNLTFAPSTNVGNQMYKTMQFLYAAKKFKATKVSALIFKDDFAKFRLDSLGSAANGVIYGRKYDQKGVNSRITLGLLTDGAINKQVKFTLGGYFQTGKNREGRDLSAYTFTGSLSYTKGKMTVGVGYDYLSGNDQINTSTTDNRFDPLYGTPHKFWGLMDFFYVGTGALAGGLSNPFAKLKYVVNPKLSMVLDVHYFSIASPMKGSDGKELSKGLGSEFDFIVNYILNKMTIIELGLCAGQFTDSMEFTKNGTIGKANQSPTWAYLMINIRPEIFSTAIKK